MTEQRRTPSRSFEDVYELQSERIRTLELEAADLLNRAETAEQIAEKLWDKYGNEILYGDEIIPYHAFLAALKEYGEAVRQKAIKSIIYAKDNEGPIIAIERMKLP